MTHKQLSEPAARHKNHRRTITIDGYVRDDGLFDIEAELKDTKSYSFPSRAHGEIKKGEALHHMQVRVTVCENFEVKAAEAVTIAGPYHECPQGATAIKHLIGKTIQPGWQKIVKRAIGGTQGCTHIKELMGPVATVAFQTIFGEKARRARQNAPQDSETETAAANKALLNSCYALSEGKSAALWNWGIPLESEKEQS